MWITEFREQFGLDLEQLGAQIRRVGARKDPPLRVSDILLYRLETDPKFRTVPALADLIAEACGATAQQRDALVLPKHRGTWKPPRRRETVRPRAAAAPAPPPEPPKVPQKPYTKPALKVAHVVVRLNREGEELGRYASVSRAALDSLATTDQIISRCMRRYTLDEFKAYGYTYRYAEEWDRMSGAERAADLSRNDGVRGTRGGSGRNNRMVTVIDRGGHAVNYESVGIAAANVGLTYAAAIKRLRKAQDRPIHADRYKDLTIMYTRDWEALTPEAQWQIWRREVELG